MHISKIRKLITSLEDSQRDSKTRYLAALLSGALVLSGAVFGDSVSGGAESVGIVFSSAVSRAHYQPEL